MGRNILKGVWRYVASGRPWSLYHEPNVAEGALPDWLASWRGDGIIACVRDRRVAEAIASLGVPAVDVGGGGGVQPSVQLDDLGIADLAAEHFMDRGFDHFAFVGLENDGASLRRRNGFRAALANQAATFRALELASAVDGVTLWEAEIARLSNWVADLPKPCAVLVSRDQRVPDLVEAARLAAASVPDQVAVLGVDNDPVFCEIGPVSVSSVCPALDRAGFLAAELLDRIMRGEPRPERPIIVPPRGVETRASTEALAVRDQHVARALQFINRRGCEAIGVDDVVRASGLSRTLLQERFRRSLNKTIHQQIVTVRINCARRLLVNSDLPLLDIAERAGFKHQEYMGAVFKARLDKTPAQYRRELA